MPQSNENKDYNIKYVYEGGDPEIANEPPTKATRDHEVLIRVKSESEGEKIIQNLTAGGMGKTHEFNLAYIGPEKIVVRGRVKQ